MNSPVFARTLRPLAAAGFGFVALLLFTVTARALEIRLAPGRSAHGFAFASPDNPNEITGAASGGFVNGAAGEEG